MYKPNFKYTDEIVNNLTYITESKAIILNAPLLPKWKVSLRRDAILSSTYSSTSIEGNSLSLKEVAELSEGKDINVWNKDKNEVLNYLEALNQIPKFSKKDYLTLEDLLKLHKIITKNTLEYFENEGVLRDQQVFVMKGRKIVFTPPKTKEVPELIDNFLEWFNSSLNINPIIIAGLTHYELVRIHPFIDGNGRFARAMATLVLYKYGFDLNKFFTLDDYYNLNRPAYYDALNKVDPDTIDLTQWIEYFTKGVKISIKSVKRKVLAISKDAKFIKEKGQIELNERQMTIVEKIIEKEYITNKMIQKLLSLSRTSAVNEINKLIDLKVIKREGRGRNTYYVLNI